MIQPLLQAMSKAVNAYLQLDPESTHRLKKLEGKTVSIELLPLHLILHYQFSETGVSVTRHLTQPADATIRGTPWQLLTVMVTKENRQRFFAEDVKMEGNVDVANQVVKLFDEMHIDLENELSRFIGDKTAYHLSNVIKNTKNWLNTTVDSFADNINEYTHEEAQWFPPKEALNDFFNEIDELSMAVDRFASKIKEFEIKTLKDEEKQ